MDVCQHCHLNIVANHDGTYSDEDGWVGCADSNRGHEPEGLS